MKEPTICCISPGEPVCTRSNCQLLHINVWIHLSFWLIDLADAHIHIQCMFTMFGQMNHLKHSESRFALMNLEKFYTDI